MKKIRDYKWPILLLFAGSVAIAAGIQQKFPTDLVIFGLSTSSDDKVLEIDTGDGASNPKITIDMTNKDFDLNKALNIVDDLLKLGTGAAADQVIEFDIGAGVANPKFKWDNANQSLSFANDGVNFKNLGSGSGSGGGGTNVLAELNFDFETADPPQDWTASGGTFSAETTSPLFGEQSGLWDSNALSQTLDSPLAPITTGFLGRACQVEFEYKYPVGNAGDYKLVVRQYDDSGATELSVLELPLDVSTVARKAQQTFTCPDDVADTLRWRIESTVADADPITVDNVFLGTGRNTFVFGPVIGEFASYSPGGAWSGNGTYDGRWRQVGDVMELYITFLASSTPAGQFTAELPAGYVIDTAKLAGSLSGADAHTVGVGYVFDAGTSNSCGIDVILNGTTAVRGLDHSGVLDQGMTCEDGTGFTFANGDAIKLKIAVPIVGWDSGPVESITLETSGTFFAGAISGDNPNLGTGVFASRTQINNASLSLAKKPNSGDVKIACAGAVANGTTCSASNEVVGIVFDAPKAGDWEICFDYNHFVDVSTAGGAVNFETSFSINETNLDGSAILSAGFNERTAIWDAGGAGNTEINQRAMITSTCETFALNSSGEKRFELRFRQPATTGVDINRLQADGTTNGYGIYFSAHPMSNQFPTPVFTDLQNSLKQRPKTTTTNQQRIEHGIIDCNVGGCTVTASTSGDWISSVSRTGLGAYTVNFDQVFGVAPVCVMTPWVQVTGSCTEIRNLVQTTISVGLDTFQSNGSGQDCGFMIMCMGGE